MRLRYPFDVNENSLQKGNFDLKYFYFNAYKLYM